MRRNFFVVFGVLVALAVAVYGVLYGWPVLFSGEQSPEELARSALEAPTPREQEEAVVQLAQFGTEAREQLRRVLAESKTPRVRAACIRALAGQLDYDNMPAFLDALDDDSALVRGRAGAAVQQMLYADVAFPYDAPPVREPAAKDLRERWEIMRDSPIMKKWKQRQAEKNL